MACCSVLQCVAVCCSVLQCVAVCFSINGVLQCIMNMVCCGLLKKRFVRWTRVCVLQDDWCVAVYYIYGALQCNEKETSPLDYRVSLLQDKERWCVAECLVCCSVLYIWCVAV